MNRLNYIDNVRVVLSILVVLHHVSIAYGAMGNWCYIAPEQMIGWQQLFISTIFGIEATFSMSLFFFLSAYFTPTSIDKKGNKNFIYGQLLRLGIPLITVVLILDPLLLYGIAIYSSSGDVSLVSFLNNHFINSSFSTSHLWFVFALLLFELVYVLYRKYSAISVSALITNKIPSNAVIGLVTIMLGITSFMLRQFFPIGAGYWGLNFGNFTLYIFMYALGILVKRKNWIDGLSDKISRSWAYFSFALSPLLGLAMCAVFNNQLSLLNFLGGMHLESLLLALWEPFVCIGISFFIISFSRKKLNYTNHFLKFLSLNRYAVYIFHSIFVVSVTILLEPLPVEPLIKFFIASILSLFISFYGAYLIRKIPNTNIVL